jgi:hypothetical protein
VDYTKLTDAQIGYFAGIVDGEGCFTIGLYGIKSKFTGKILMNYHTYIKISNTDENLIKWIHEVLGGTNWQQHRTTRINKYDRTVYNIQLSGESLDLIMPIIYPHLIVKKPQCEVMMKMRSTFKKNKGLSKKQISQEFHNLRHSCYSEMRSLNSRWHNHPLKPKYDLAPCCPSA